VKRYNELNTDRSMKLSGSQYLFSHKGCTFSYW